MSQNYTDVDALEFLRESGDYDRIASELGDRWQLPFEFDVEAIRLRVLAAEVAGRNGRNDDMDAAIGPLLDNVDRVPFSLAPRVLLVIALYHYRHNEPSEAHRLAVIAETVAGVREDEFNKGRGGTASRSGAVVTRTMGGSGGLLRKGNRYLCRELAPLLARAGVSLFGCGAQSNGHG